MTALENLKICSECSVFKGGNNTNDYGYCKYRNYIIYIDHCESVHYHLLKLKGKQEVRFNNHTICIVCGKPIDQEWLGRFRKYCSNRCKKIIYNDKKRSEKLIKKT